MKRWTLAMMCVVTLFSIGLTASSAMAQPAPLLSVPVAFGRGLNTAQAGNVVNHVILPDEIQVKLGGVVHFLVAGFHQVVVYKPGTEPEDIDVPASGTFINDADNQFYLGINPAGGPGNTPATPVVPGDTRSNAQNRLESVSFPAEEGRSTTGTLLSEKAEPGVYLVICNVRGHFLDGMFAFVRVVP
jgi:plastocyanin